MARADALDLPSLLGGADVYLVDQLQRGRVGAGARVVELGCGGGRNLEVLVRAGCEVWASDAAPEAVAAARGRVRALAPELGAEELERRFRVEALEDTTFDAGTFDLVVCNAVLHFARDAGHFRAMLDAAWRLVRPGGLLFARLASSIGIERAVRALGDGRFLVPDGSERYLVDEETLVGETARLGAELADPIKTTNVQGRRCMTTWVLRRPGAPRAETGHAPQAGA